jgi:hypothetical protein
MMKRFAGFLLVFMLSAQLWAGATFSRVTTWSDGQTLTAANLNAEFDNILNNGTPTGWDDYSATVSQMQSTADPYPGSVESQATSLAGEIERLRYQILEIKKAIQPSGVTYWYQDAPTAGVFSIVGSSVGVNDTTPDAALDVAGTLQVDGVVTVSSITSTLPSLYIATNTTIAGTLTLNSSTKIVAVSTAAAVFTGNAAVTFFTEEADTLGEFYGSSATIVSSGYYFVGASFGAACSGSGTAQAKIYVNGVQKDIAACDSPTGAGSLHVSSVLSLSAGDIVSIRGANGLFVIGAAGFDRFWMVRQL